MENNHGKIIKNRYQFIPRTLVFIKDKDKYLFIQKKNRDSFGFNKLNGVGGHIEKGEEPYEAARREITEETGLHVNNLELAAILFIDINQNPGIQVFVFKSDHFQGNIKQSDEGELQWISVKEIKKNDKFVWDAAKLIEICEKHTIGSHPKIIKYVYNDSGKLRIVI